MEWPRFVHVFVDKNQKVVDFAFPNEKLLFSVGIEFTYRVEKVGQEYKHRFDAGIEMSKNPLNTLVSSVMPLHHISY
jgi:hypothetical protein